MKPVPAEVPKREGAEEAQEEEEVVGEALPPRVVVIVVKDVLTTLIWEV